MSLSNRNRTVRSAQSRRTIALSRRMLVRGAGGGAAAAAFRSSPSLSALARQDSQATPIAGGDGVVMHPVYSFEGQFTDVVPVGLVPRGIRIDIPFTGEVVTGPFEGADVDGIDYLLLRADGVGVMDVHRRMTSREGHVISVSASGYVIMPTGVELPPPDVMLSPDFVWPDMDVSLYGSTFYETGAADLAWLNHTVLVAIGRANLGTWALSATMYAFTPIPELASG